jgi:hypothetical protein
MKKNLNGNFLKLLFPFLIVFLLFFVTACKQSQQGQDHTQFAQLKYTAAQVNHWLTNPATNNFVFQFYTSKAEDTKRPYQLISYIIDTAGNYLNATNPDTLTIHKDSLIDLSGKAVLGNTYVSKKAILSLTTDSTGKMRPFDYLLFVPKIDASNQHVIYQIELIKGTTAVLGAPGGIDSNPSPPATLP